MKNFKKAEFKDKLRILCNDKNKSDWIAQHTDCVCKSFYLYDKREKNKSGIKKALIFTDSDQLEMIETLITGIPGLEFYIAHGHLCRISYFNCKIMKMSICIQWFRKKK